MNAARRRAQYAGVALTAQRPARVPWPLARIMFCFFFLVYGSVLLIARNPPAFVDYPDWVYQGELFHRELIHSPTPGYALKSYPVPNSLTTIGIGVLSLAVSWEWAGKVWICVYFATAILTTFRLARVMEIEDHALWLVLPGTVFMNLDFWYGHINFEFGLCVFLFFVSMLFDGRRYKLGYAWMLTLLFFIHMEACACGLLLFLIFCVWQRSLKLLWQALPVSLLTAWYGVARFRAGNIDSTAASGTQHHYGSIDFIVFKIGTYFKTLGYVNVTSMEGLSKTEAIFGRPLMLFFIGLSFFIGIGLLLLLREGIAKRARTGRDTEFAWIFIVATLMIAGLLPQVFLGTADPGSRLILVSVTFMLFLLAKNKNRLMTLIALGSLILCSANLWQLLRIGANPYLLATQQDNLPGVIRQYAHVEPEIRLGYYRSLEAGELNQTIFPTALLYETIDHHHSSANANEQSQ